MKKISFLFIAVLISAVLLDRGLSSALAAISPSGAATTLGDNSTFIGNNIDASGIALGNNVNFIGRALAFGGTVTTRHLNTC